jgi:hypothetical protein
MADTNTIGRSPAHRILCRNEPLANTNSQMLVHMKNNAEYARNALVVSAAASASIYHIRSTSMSNKNINTTFLPDSLTDFTS